MSTSSFVITPFIALATYFGPWDGNVAPTEMAKS